jgi:hypothetical protein
VIKLNSEFLSLVTAAIIGFAIILYVLGSGSAQYPASLILNNCYSGDFAEKTPAELGMKIQLPKKPAKSFQ